MRKEHQLIIESFTLAPQIATIKWNQLVHEIPFGDLDAASIRMLPLIYTNLNDSKRNPNYFQLKGAYRYNWTKNAQNIHSAESILKEIETLDYRILKGWALNFMTSQLGQRVTGDLDILVSKNDFVRIIQILEANGYERKFNYDCPLNANTNNNSHGVDITYHKKEAIEVDIHLENSIRPLKLFKFMLRDNPKKVSWKGTSVKIPSPELLLAHSLIHGFSKVNYTDELQTVGDIKVLSERVSIKKLEKTISQLKIQYIAENYSEYFKLNSNLKNINLRNKAIHSMKQDFDSIAHRLEKNLDFYKIVHLIKLRRKPKDVYLQVKQKFNGKRRIYVAWMKLGSLRNIELAINQNIYFLDKPCSALGESTEAVLFNGVQNNKITESNVAECTQDWRFTVQTIEKFAHLSVKITHENFLNGSYAIFVNGNLKGTTTKSEHYIFELNEPSRFLEFSIRNPHHSCLFCGFSLKGLKIQILQLKSNVIASNT